MYKTSMFRKDILINTRSEKKDTSEELVVEDCNENVEENVEENTTRLNSNPTDSKKLEVKRLCCRYKEEKPNVANAKKVAGGFNKIKGTVDSERTPKAKRSTIKLHENNVQFQEKPNITLLKTIDNNPHDAESDCCKPIEIKEEGRPLIETQSIMEESCISLGGQAIKSESRIAVTDKAPRLVGSKTINEIESISQNERQEECSDYNIGELGEVLSVKSIKDLKRLLFGSSSSKGFSYDWCNETLKRHGNTISMACNCKNGPEAIIASLQCWLIKSLIIGSDQPKERLKRCNDLEWNDCLLNAIVDSIWQAGDMGKCILAVYNNKDKLNHHIDDMFFNIRTFQFECKDSALLFLQAKANTVWQKYDLVLYLISLVLSRSVDRIEKDIANETPSLIDSHHQPTQALINLCLTGSATPFICNGVVEKEAPSGKIIRYQGIERRSQIGFLTTNVENKSHKARHNDELISGSRYKTPYHPIWLLNAKEINSFVIGFSIKANLLNDWRLEKKFDLYLCQMGKNSLPRLTLDSISTPAENEGFDEDEEESWIENILKARWIDVTIDWNGYPRW